MYTNPWQKVDKRCLHFAGLLPLGQRRRCDCSETQMLSFDTEGYRCYKDDRAMLMFANTLFITSFTAGNISIFSDSRVL